MRFAVLLPWWGYLLVFAGAVALAILAYARVPLPLSRGMRGGLIALRFLTLAAIITVLLRPIELVPPSGGEHSLVPVLVDVSRSMRLPDGTGITRLARAQAIVRDLQQKLGATYRVELLTFGEALAAGEVDRLAATARRSDLTDALAALSDRHRAEPIASIIVLSDGGDTSNQEHAAGPGRAAAAPVLAVGIGERTGVRDREIVNFTAGEPLLPGASIDLSVSAISVGYGKDPVEIRVSESGRPVDVRRITPPADGAPIHEVFTVSPAPDAATVYTVEIPQASGELSNENNTRSVLVPPQAGRRRLLVVEGAPGFEHTFLKRALAHDPGMEIDALVRKGQNDDGHDTFYVQAGGGRGAALSGGYPSKKSELFQYDGIIFGNVEADFFTRDQLDLTAEFVASRGGGLLVLGARSFDRQGLAGTPLEEVLPIDLTDRGGIARASSVTDQSMVPNTVALTADGAQHPATRLAAAIDESRKKWAELPPLASIAAIGGPRPGAQVLAVGVSQGSGWVPLLASQRYGQGRTMVFAGEASWRWRMMLPVTDTRYETIWRQMARWVTAGSPGPVMIAPMSPGVAGETDRVVVTVRNQEFAPVGNAEVTLRLQAPDGQARTLTPALTSPQEGRYAVAVRFDQPGVYRIDASANADGKSIGSATRQVLVGGVDLEMSQPRLNEAVLRRLASASNGHYVPADQAGTLPGLVREAKVDPGEPEARDLWHNGWSFAAIAALLGAEWLLRRSVGLA